MKKWIYLIIPLILASCEIKIHKEVKPVKVEVFTVEPRTIPINYEFVGVVASSHPVEIRPRIDGYIQKVAFKEGSYVNKGDLLFIIDPKPFEVAVGEAQANLAKQIAYLENVTLNVNRLERLYAQDAVSKKSLDDARAEKNQAEASIAAVQARVESAELNFSYTHITSPISGLASEAKFLEGSFVSPGTGSLTTISAIDPIWVNFSVSEGDLLKAKREIQEKKLIYPDKNFDVKLKLSDGTVFPLKGEVNFASPVLDQKTGTLNVRANFPNPNAELIPGLFVRAEVSGAQMPNAIYVPQKAIVQNMSGSFVYVVGKDNKVEQRAVELGDWYQNYWIVKSGLNSGDVVVVEGVNKIEDGSEVEF